MSSSKGVIKSSAVKVVERVRHADCSVSPGATFQVNPLIPGAQKSGVGPPQEREAEMEERIGLAKQDAYQKGLAEGVNKGIALQKEEARRMIAAVTDLMGKLTRLRQDMMEQAEQQIMGLSFAIAEKVIHREVRQDRTVVASVLREAVRSVTERDGMKVRLNPQDFHYITEIKEDFLREMDGVKNIVFEEDPGIKAGGVMVETMFGEVDARLEQQFDEIRSGFGVAG
ncbi:MAG: hypothetical protein GX147_02490 [Deltaproteobacteria bacterium]|nr:hypothetical protein [Deltaproteobacteria bacterium]